MPNASSPTDLDSASHQPPPARSGAIPAAMFFGLMLAFDVWYAVLEINRLPHGNHDALRVAAAAFVLVGLPAALGLFVLTRLLQKLTANGPAAALWLAFIALVAYLPAAAWRTTGASVHFLQQHAGLAFFLVLAALRFSFWRGSPRKSLALAGLFVAGMAVTVFAAHRNVAFESVYAEVEGLRASPPPHRGRLLVIGVDGLGWNTLQRWTAAHPGETWDWFRQRAFVAPLDTLMPTLSPRIWSSMATGVPPDEHGVVAFISWDYAGLDESRLVTPDFEGGFYWRPLLERFGFARPLPVSRLDLRRPPVWEIMRRAGLPIDVLGWWATWPAQPVSGRLVSDRFYFSHEAGEIDAGDIGITGGHSAAHQVDASNAAAPLKLTFPPELETELAPLRRAPAEMTPAELLRFVNPSSPGHHESIADNAPPRRHPLSELRYGYTIDETWFNIAMKFIGDAPGDSTMVAYFRGVDMVSHGTMQYSHLYSEAAAANEQTGALYPEVVCRYYNYAFTRLRNLIEKAGDDTLVLIVSDHGFASEGGGRFGHHQAPQGVVMAMGGGRIGTADASESHSVYDVAPTVLWLRGYPKSQDMPGRPLADLFPNLDSHSQRTLATYGYRVVLPGAAFGDAQADAEMMRLLKTLGYIR